MGRVGASTPLRVSQPVQWSEAMLDCLKSRSRGNEIRIPEN